ncbi:MAG TPA: LCP family protein [Streptosporangiaceae bacterium]
MEPGSGEESAGADPGSGGGGAAAATGPLAGGAAAATGSGEESAEVAPGSHEEGIRAGSPAPRRSRKKKVLAWTGGTLAVIALIAATGSYLVVRHLNGNLRQVDVSGIVGVQPAQTHPKAQNILVIGSDTRIGQSKKYGNSAKLNTDQSDTLLIVHIAASRKWADIMSIPRDSWVNIPSCEMSNGKMSPAMTYKINEAFAIGNLNGNNSDRGTACTIKTLERDTGIRIDHFVDINFAGFKAMVNALGGVRECNTKPIDDPLSKLHLSAGHHLLDGTEALGYVRARYTLGNGSDLERIHRQQAFMSSLVDRVKSKLLNPVAIYRFLDAATKSITIDSQLGGIHGLYDLAMSVRNLPRSKVSFFTVPTYPRSEVVPSDTANVMWTQPDASLIFQAFRDDVPVTKALLRLTKPQLPARSVQVRVLNGTSTAGLQDTAAAALKQKGFTITGTGDARTHTVTETVIRYHAGQQAAARLLAWKLHGAALLHVPGTGGITLVLGSNYGTTVHTGPGSAPQAMSSFEPRTATQNICT